jgi:uncharacterized membrane protein YraQ (UPF0718 family)
MTYMLAAPIVNPVTALSTASAFKEMPYAMASSRILFGYVIAVCVGLILLRFPVRAIMKSKIADEVDELEAQRKAEPAHDHDHCDHEQGHCDHAHEHGPTPTHSHPEQGPKLMMALRASMRDFVDVAIYFVIGITIVAIVNTPPPVEQDVVPLRDIIDGTADSTWGAPAALMGLAFLLSLCSTSDAFIAATLDAFGYGSRLAFLVFGPMMDVKLLFLYSTILTRKFILYLAIGLFISIGAISVFMEPFFTPDPPVPRMSGK